MKKKIYFEKTRRWKKDFENDYLERYPHLKKECWPVRHKKTYRLEKLIFSGNFFRNHLSYC